MKKYGIVSGSFDPITKGHVWIIKKALTMMDEVVIVVAQNFNKKCMFDLEERCSLIKKTIQENFDKNQLSKIRIRELPEHELLVSYADSIQANFIFRGLRNFTDFGYEQQLNLVQKKINPNIETVFLIPPREITEISSSLIKNIIHLREWEKIAEPYVSKAVIEALRQTHKR
jgi:pantetheine-phosphate adenylyltransferase/8-oxo-dGTP diphosphatase